MARDGEEQRKRKERWGGREERERMEMEREERGRGRRKGKELKYNKRTKNSKIHNEKKERGRKEKALCPRRSNPPPSPPSTHRATAPLENPKAQIYIQIHRNQARARPRTALSIARRQKTRSLIRNGGAL